MPAAELLDKHLAVSDYDCTMYTALIVLVALASCVAARPADGSEPIPIVSQSQEGPNPDGSYKWSYEAGNGIKAQEEGEQINVGTENEGASAQGSFSYTDENGVVISLTYKADGEGFQPVGDHLPTPPPIPEAIQRALEWIQAHPSKEEENKV